MLRAESISTLSDHEDDIDDLDGSVIWSQEEPLSSNEILELSAQDEKENSLFAFCRLCAGQTTNPIYIYSEFGESMKLAHKINTCLSIKIKKTDPLPKQLCLTCVEKVNWCDKFDTQCIKAEEILSTMLKEKQSFNISNGLFSDQQSCPLCVKGFMNVCEETFQNTKDMELYENDIILESSDEENIFNNAKVNKENGNRSITLQCLGDRQTYLKCGACMNLYHTEETLNGHKCKPSIQNTTKPYKCPICDKTFMFEERLNFHMQFHKGAKALYCEVCKITFGKELKLFYHYKRQHSKENSVSCLQCGKLFEDQEALRVHVCVDGKNRPHICEVCNKGFFDGYTLKRHVVTHLPEKPYKCSECSKSFTQKSRLNKHVASHCIVIENSQAVWRCLQCGEVFVSCDDADIHYKIIHEDKVTLIEELLTSKLYHCEFCNSHFTDADNLKTHQKHHVVERPYTCNTCVATYKSFAEAVLHWKEHPRLFKVLVVFLCDVCNKDMKELSLLYKHKQNRHARASRLSESGDAKFICELCGSVFDKSEDVQDHGRDQCSKFPCDICGSLLPTANSLNAHKRRHNGLRPYVCNICGKSYTQSSHMWTHKRFHMGIKPYACEYCDQRFTIKPDLADHVRKKHTRERPFKCEVCNKAFLTGSVFYQHRLIHRGAEHTQKRINEEANLQNPLNIEKREQYSDNKRQEKCSDHLEGTGAVIEDSEEDSEEGRKNLNDQVKQQCMEQKDECATKKLVTAQCNTIEDVENGSLTEQNPFLTLSQKLETHAVREDCIWNVYYKNIDRKMIVFGFMSNSLLITAFLSHDFNDSEENLIKEIKIISRVSDDSGILIRIVHKLILEKINAEILTKLYKTHQDILPMLNFISQDVKLAMDFMFDLRRLDDLNLMEITYDEISFVSRSKRMDIILRVTIKVKQFDKLTSNDISLHCLLGRIKVTDIKNLIKNVKRDHKFLRRYMNDVKDYIDIIEETQII